MLAPLSVDSPTAFVAPALPSIRAQPTARPAVRMSSEEHRPADAAISRRAALAALAAVVAGAAAGTAPASAGPAAKQSIFGYGGASSPYSYADQKLYTGTVLYKVRVSGGRGAGGAKPVDNCSHQMVEGRLRLQGCWGSWLAERCASAPKPLQDSGGRWKLPVDTFCSRAFGCGSVRPF